MTSSSLLNEKPVEEDLKDGGENEGIMIKKGVRTATDLQRLKLEKLLKQPEKPVFIPDRPKERKMPKPAEFIRNTWGSSAGAGSGDFHVYRGVRRREYARQKFLDEQLSKNSADTEYQQKMEANIKAAEERTAKKRAKRLKKKQKSKQKKSKTTDLHSDSGTESDEDVENTEQSEGHNESNVQKEMSAGGSEGDEHAKNMEPITEGEKTTPTDIDNPR